MEPDLFKCRQIPYYCDDKQYPKYVWDVARDLNGEGSYIVKSEEYQVIQGYVEDENWRLHTSYDFYQMTKGCCQCERHHMPYFFKDETAVEGFPDDKHSIQQISIIALDHVELTITMELLNGIYYTVFDDYMPGKTDLSIHTPNRARYTPSNPSRAAFLSLIVEDDYDSMELPLNLPIETYRLPGEPLGDADGTTSDRFATKVLINRNANLRDGDPEFETRYTNRARKRYFDYVLSLPNESVALPFDQVETLIDVDAESEKLFTISEPFSQLKKESDWFTVGDSSGENTFLGLPYFPYFSNCKGYDSFMSMSKFFETNPECKFVSYEKTKPVDQYIWNAQLTPSADTCRVVVPPEDQYRIINSKRVKWFDSTRGSVMNCTFEENIDIPTGNPRWYEMAGGSYIFYISKEPIGPNGYDPVFRQNPDFTRNYTQRWGRSSKVASLVGTFKVIPVEVDPLNEGLNNVVPRQVRLTISYYQVDKGYKRVVSAMISYLKDYHCHTLTSGSTEQENLEKSGISQCVIDYNGNIATSEYQLEILYLPLPWFDLLNLFEFTADVYMFFYTLAGFLSIMVAVGVYTINRVLTKLRHPPPFHSFVLYHIISEAPLVGCMIACAPVLVAVLWISGWLTAYADGGVMCSPDPVSDPSPICFEDIAGDWSDSLTLDLTRINLYRVGRIGTCLLGVGLYITFLSAILIIPKWSDERSEDDAQAEAVGEVAEGNGDEDEKVAPSEIWVPMQWKRAHLMLASFLLEFMMMIAIQFSFSDTFGTNVYLFIILFKIFQKYMDSFFLDMLKEQLMIVPLVVLYTSVEGLMTMGADSFSSFILSYFVELCVMVIERCYLDPSIAEMTKLWPRWAMQFKRAYGSNRRMTREEKAEEELEWRRINEEIELESEGIEPLLDSYTGYSTEVASLFIFPLLDVILYIFYTELNIAPLYGILENQMIYYILFAAYIIPWLLTMDVFLLNTQELIHGWKVYDYVSYQRYRFSVRENRWMLRSNLLDESISEGFQTLDMMCFSSQYYFIITLFTMGMFLILFAMDIYIENNYNPFADPVALLLIVLMIILCKIIGFVMLKLGDIKILRIGWRGMWMTKQIEGTVDDEVAAKLAIGEGRQQDLEQERMELQALNSERFRHRFLERNRPWILHHLVELLTPRSLETTGHDGRPVIEYVRDVYADLMSMGEGMKRAGDRDDISSDEEDALEAARRNWSRQPLVGASLAIARMWLAKARKRRAFTTLIRGIIDSHKKTSCEVCGRTPELNNVRLLAYLATRGEPDPYAIDRLIAMFENQYSPDELDPQLWKAFFRAHAEYATRCTVCEDSLEQDRLNKAGREPGKSRVIRPDDVSSDDDNDERVYEPMIVNRTSAEGRMMSKWLTAARTKLGGQFPREDARKQMEKYTQKMRQLKMKKAKEEIGKASYNNEDKLAEQKRALEEQFGQITVNAATKALTERWLRKARDSIEGKFREKSIQIREDLTNCLEKMPEAEDWYFGAQMRLEGGDLLTRGMDLNNDRKTLESEAAIKIRKLETDFAEFKKDKEAEMQRERKAFEQSVAEKNDKSTIQIDARWNDLQRARDEKRKEFDKVEKIARDEQGAAPTEMIQAHRNHIQEMENNAKLEKKKSEDNHSNEIKTARMMFDKAEALQKAEVGRRQAMCGDNIARIRVELAEHIKSSESDWQNSSLKWLTVAKKKIQVKDREDLEAKKVKKRRK
jgi:hypothetical protein